jgi:hypothetical protein
MSLSEKEIPVAYYVKKVNVAKNEDIVEYIANNANDLASKVRDA